MGLGAIPRREEPEGSQSVQILQILTKKDSKLRFLAQDAKGTLMLEFPVNLINLKTHSPRTRFSI
jgi:hypothetical protein